jgi:uncharacterized membrane protein
MKKTIRKVFFIWEYEKEENWLNEMSEKGWQLEWASIFKYVFVKGEPGEYKYRLELLEKKTSTEESSSYLNFLKETGVELVGECRNWIYLRSRIVDGGFEPSNKTLYQLTHLMKIQDFLNKFKNNLIPMIAVSFIGILALEEFSGIRIVDFFRGFCTGIGISGSFVALAFMPLIKKNDKKIKAAIKELYTCE